MTHTPGPWEFEPPIGNRKERSGGDIDGAGTHAVPIAEIAWNESHETSSANTKLIAAAPELLEALKWATAFAAGSMEADQRLQNDVFIRRLSEAQAAIAKATT